MNPAADALIDSLRSRDLFDLVLEICRARGVLVHDVCGRGRSRSVSAARHEAWWRIRHHPARCYSLSDIGRLFDRDHSTILCGLRAHDRRLRGATRPSEAS